MGQPAEKRPERQQGVFGRPCKLDAAGVAVIENRYGQVAQLETETDDL